METCALGSLTERGRICMTKGFDTGQFERVERLQHRGELRDYGTGHDN